MKPFSASQNEGGFWNTELLHVCALFLKLLYSQSVIEKVSLWNGRRLVARPSVPVLSSPHHWVLSQAPGSSSRAACQQLSEPAAHVLSRAVEASLYGRSFGPIFGMLWRSSCQHLCCLQNEEIIMAENKALSISVLKHGRFFFSLAVVCLLYVSMDCNSWWEPSGEPT